MLCEARRQGDQTCQYLLCCALLCLCARMAAVSLPMFRWRLDACLLGFFCADHATIEGNTCPESVGARACSRTSSRSTPQFLPVRFFLGELLTRSKSAQSRGWCSKFSRACRAELAEECFSLASECLVVMFSARRYKFQPRSQEACAKEVMKKPGAVESVQSISLKIKRAYKSQLTNSGTPHSARSIG